MVDVAAVVRGLCPSARLDYLEAFARHGDALTDFGIATPQRIAHFLAQILHESGGLTVTRENMRYSAGRIVEIFGVGRHSAAVTEAEAATLAGQPEALAERVYGQGTPRKAAELGNVHPGDGYQYRGGGLMQTTGRDAYRGLGHLIEVDLEDDPDLITAPAVALLPGLHEWRDGGCNALADADDIERITRKINGGINGIDDRKRWLARVRTAMLQVAVTAAGHDCGRADGDAGAKTRAAVAAYQSAQGLPSTGIADADTLAALGLGPAGRGESPCV